MLAETDFIIFLLSSSNFPLYLLLTGETGNVADKLSWSQVPIAYFLRNGIALVTFSVPKSSWEDLWEEFNNQNIRKSLINTLENALISKLVSMTATSFFTFVISMYIKLILSSAYSEWRLTLHCHLKAVIISFQLECTFALVPLILQVQPHEIMLGVGGKRK